MKTTRSAKLFAEAQQLIPVHHAIEQGDDFAAGAYPKRIVVRNIVVVEHLGI